MTLRVATFNVNGIRAAQRRGFEAWLAEREPDVVALQEVRCPPAQLPPGVFGDHHLTYEPGQIAGRNGVAVLTRTRPAAVRTCPCGRTPVTGRTRCTDPVPTCGAPCGRVRAQRGSLMTWREPQAWRRPRPSVTAGGAQAGAAPGRSRQR